MSTKTTFPFMPGDVFFLRSDTGWLNGIIDRTEGPHADVCHCGVVTSVNGDIIETSAYKTHAANLGADYAGSHLLVVRWAGMTPDRALAGIDAILGQVGKVYPYGRMFIAALGVREGARTDALDCVGLAATTLAAAEYPLIRPVLAYYPQGLADELVGDPNCAVLLDGSLRANGHIKDS